MILLSPPFLLNKLNALFAGIYTGGFSGFSVFGGVSFLLSLIVYNAWEKALSKDGDIGFTFLGTI